MKLKLLFGYLFIGMFLFQANAQTINQNAAWPNASWTVTGTFDMDPLAFEADPTLTANFAFDDDDAGSGSDDQIAAESPVIDLTAAVTAGETWITVSGNYVYNFNTSDVLQFEYWDADTSTWNIIGTPFDSDTASAPTNDFCMGTSEAYTTGVLDIAGFTATQLSGFKYRIFWDDSLAGAAWQWGFCFDAPTITSATPPSCVDVSGIATANVTATTADISWTAGGTETVWEVAVQTAGTGVPTAAGVSTMANAPYAATALTAGTAYEVYVRADCGTNGFSNWVGPVNFTTLNNPPPVPVGVTCTTGGSSIIFVEDFEMDPPAGWTGTGFAGSNGNWDITTGGNSSGTGPSGSFSGGSYLEYEASGNSTTIASAISPQIDMTPATDGAELSFYLHAFGADMGTLNVNVGTAATGPFTNVYSWTGDLQTADTDPWVPVGVNLDAYLGQIIYLEFSYGGAGTGFEGDLSIDFIQVETCGSFCVDPSALTASNVGSTTADLAWTENGTATVWNVELVDVTAGASVTGTATNLGVANPFNITGLTPDNDYEFYVQADCGGSGTSAFVGPFAFRTACAAVVAPYIEDFEMFTTSTSAFTSGNCWAGTGGSYFWESASGTDTSSTGTGPAPSITTGNYFFTEATSGATGDTTDLISPQVDLSSLTTPALSFDYHMFGGDMGTLDVLVNGTTNVWTLSGEQQMSDTDPWGLAVVDLSAFAGQTISVTFRGTKGGGFESDMAIDNVGFDEAPSCFVPSNVTVTATTIDGATIDFTNSNTSTNSNIEYGAPGFTQGTGTVLPQTTIPFTVTGLMSATTYDFYLQSDCGMGDVTAWVGPFSFTTDCVAIADFNENFDGVSTPDLPVCWSAIAIENATGTDPAVTTSTAADNSAPNGARLYNGSGDLTTPNDVILISPELSNLQAQTHRLKFFADGSPAGDVEVGTITDPSNPATFTLLQTVAITTTHTEYIVNFDTYAGTDAYIAFRHPNSTTFDSIYLDDIVWEAIPACVAPTDLALVLVSDTAVTLTWTNNAGATASSVIYGAPGFDPLVAGTTVAGSGDMAMITGLMPDTTYDFYVTQDCSATGDGLSIQLGPINVTTACAPLTAPYTEDFENAGAIPNCWRLGGDDNWEFNTSGPNHVGNGGTLSGATASGNYYAVLDDSDPTATDGQLNSPFVDVSGLISPELSFYEISDNEGFANATLTVSVWDGAAWNIMGVYNTNTNGWELKVIDLSILTFTGPAQARFSVADSGSFYDDIAIDDVTFAEAPICNDVTAVMIDSVTSDSITVSWTENSIPASTAWEVIAVPAGTAAPATGSSNATTNPFTINTLSSSTDYDIYVRAECSTTFVGPLAATTSAGCGDMVFDTGGAAGNYSNNEAYTVTYLPDAPGNLVTLDFTLVDLENCCDTLEVFDGLDVTAVALSTDLESPASFRATNPDGAITIRFTSDFSVNAAGWEANYTCAAAPTCLEPTALTASNITTTTADLTWTSGGSGETAWDVELVLAGTVPTGTPTDAGVANPFMATALSSGTDYEYYVRAACGPGDVSLWSGPFAFTTLAACGDTVYDTGGATGDYSNGESYTVTYLPDTMANVVTLDFTLVVLENCCDTLEVFDGIDVTAPVLEADLESPASFTALNTDGAITIRFTSDGSVTDAGWEANYTCTPRPTCVDVSGVTIDSVTTDSVTVSWTENNIPAGTAWEVIAVPTGDPAPTAGTSNATVNPFTISSLMPNTTYDVYVRTDCSMSFTGPVMATTDCAVNSVYPYVTDFTNNVPNACWDEAGSGEITDGPMTIGASQWRANRSYEDFAGNVTPSNAMNLYRNSDREWLLSEQYDMTGTSNDVLSIEVAVTDWTNIGASDATDTDTMGSDDQVDLLITTDGGTTWTSLMTWNAANQPAVDGTREDIDLSSYTGTVQFAFFATDGTVNDLEDYDFHVGMFIIDGTAGNQDLTGNSLSLYPNPVNGDTVTISMSNTNNASVQIAIFNTLGQQVLTRSYPQATNEIRIDNLSRLSKGMYLIKVTDGKQESTLKFIKG